jgi:predicted GNAT family N-acyltransferase
MIKLKQLLYEAIDENDLIVVSTPTNVSISYRISLMKGATASIDRIDNNEWWVSRVLVSDESSRRQGIGSILLTRAVQEVLKHEPNAKIIVAPGGYESKTRQQTRFYKKNGFIPVKGQLGVLMYNNPNISK